MLNLSRDAFTAHSCIRRLRVELLEPEKKDLDLIEILDGPDGFDPRRFGPSGRRMWMFDTGADEREEGYQRAKQRMRGQDEIGRS